MVTPPDRWKFWAATYPLMESLALGNSLRKARLAAVQPLLDRRSVLLLGDGDGRFLVALMQAGFGGKVVSLDVSGAMLERSRRRLERVNPRAAGRVSWVRGDATTGGIWSGIEPVEAVVAQFFFDNFSDSTVHRIIAQVSGRTMPGARWEVAEFRDPEAMSGALWRLRQRWLLAVLYRAFRWTTRLEARRLPEWRAALNAQRWLEMSVGGCESNVIEISSWKRGSSAV